MTLTDLLLLGLVVLVGWAWGRPAPSRALDDSWGPVGLPRKSARRRPSRPPGQTVTGPSDQVIAERYLASIGYRRSEW